MSAKGPSPRLAVGAVGSARSVAAVALPGERRPVLLLAATLIATIVLTAVAALAPTPAWAADGAASEVAWGIRPADGELGSGRDNFRYSAAPGETITDALVVTNRGAIPLALGVYGADGSISGGQIELAAAEATPVGLGAWLTVATTALELAPGESAEVSFTLGVPPGTAPGEAVGGVVTSSIDPGGEVTVDRRLAASIVVSVADATPDSPSSADGVEAPPRATGPAGRRLALLGVVGLLVVAAGVWGVVLQGRAKP